MPAVIPTRYLEIASLSMSIYGAWMVTDYTDLLREADQRGDDRLIPQVAGRAPYKRYRDSSRRLVPMDIFGANDQAGSVHANEVDGLEANFAYLNTTVVAPTGTGDGTRAATLHLPGGNRTANVHVLSLTPGRRGPAKISAVLELSIPAGRFA